MKIITTISEMKEISKLVVKQNKTIGFVPTMGFLHEGHLSLIDKARKSCDIVILSVFVNPLQFGVNEDFDKYPRNIEHDQELAQSVGADYFFMPSVDEMYPNELVTSLKVRKISDVLCGAKREGHFDGVATVVMKLLNIVSPDKLFMGIKDAQQVAVVQKMINDFNMDVQVIPVEIMREKNGLAMSSRNKYLTEEELVEAPVLYQVLKQVQEKIPNGMRETERIIAFIESKYLTLNAKIDYIEVLSYPTLENLAIVSDTFIVAVAVKFPNARLIDNVIMTLEN